MHAYVTQALCVHIIMCLACIVVPISTIDAFHRFGSKQLILLNNKKKKVFLSGVSETQA